ncbi:hypothetical protein ACHAXR_004551 [Thalassiosira sp. AJA248-18]
MSTTDNEATASTNHDDAVVQPKEQEEQPNPQSKQQQQLIHQIISLFVSTFLFSLMGMFLQLASSHGVPSTEIVFSRSAFQGIFIVLGCLTFRLDGDSIPTVNEDYNSMNEEEKIQPQPSLPPRIIQHPFGTTYLMTKVVIFRGLFGGLSFMFKFHALSALPLGDATALMSLYPIITIFLANFVLGETIQPVHIVAAMSSVVGAILIARPGFLFGDDGNGDDDEENASAIGYITALLASIFSSLVIVMIRKAGKVGAHTLQLLFSWMVFGMTLSLLGGAIAGKSGNDSQQWIMPPREAIPSLLGTCVSGGMAHFLLNYSGKFLPATMSGLIRSTGILWAYLLEIVVFGQLPQKETLWGVFFIGSSLMLVLFSSHLQEKVKEILVNKNVLQRLPSVGDTWVV